MLQIRYKNSEKRPLWLVDAKYTVGRDVSCDIQVEDPAVAPLQAELHVTQDEVAIHNLGEPEMVSVNGAYVSQALKVVHGDEVIVGSQVFELIDPKTYRAQTDTGKQAAIEEVSASGWSLKASNTALANKSFPIDRDVVVGRSNECDITLGVAHLSRRHARLYFSGNQLEVEDLRSSNGTYVNGKQVQRSLLRSGDELSLDTLSFKVIGPEDDSESTMLRPHQDIDKTTVRPAIKVDQIKNDGGGTKYPRPSKPAAKPTPTGTYAVQSNKEDDESSSALNGIVIGIVVIVLLAGAYWLFLS